MDPRRICVDSHRFCAESCEAIDCKLVILLKAVRDDCGAIGSKLLILLKNCASAWFWKKTDRGVKRARRGSPT